MHARRAPDQVREISIQQAANLPADAGIDCRQFGRAAAARRESPQCFDRRATHAGDLLVAPAAIAAQRQRLRHWFFRFIYPRVFTKAMSPEEARAVFAASPFGAPAEERMLLDGVFWVFRVRKAGR